MCGGGGRGCKGRADRGGGHRRGCKGRADKGGGGCVGVAFLCHLESSVTAVANRHRNLICTASGSIVYL